MKTILWRVVLIVLAVAIAGGVLWGYFAGRGEQTADAKNDAPVSAPSRVSSEDGRAVLRFDPAAQRANGIVTAVLDSRRERPENQATGVVVQLQPLITLKTSFNTPTTDLIRARGNARASSAEYARLRRLNLNGNNASAKAVEAARATAEGDAALVENAREALSVLKATTLLHWGPVVAHWVENDTSQWNALLMQRMFLLQVTGTTGGSLSTPRRATVRLPDGAHTTAHFVSVLPQLDPRLQTPSLLYSLTPHPGLVPGVNLSVFLPSGKEQTGVVIPRSAVVWTQGSAWCYVEDSIGRFVRTEVATIDPNSQGWFVTRGITPGARVVVAGAQTLLSEEFRSQIQADQD